MCIALFSLQHPDYALILCSNRDEHLARPTLPARFHPSHVLAGTDVQAGGTWLGLHRAGKLALVTNITEPPRAFASSRGHLVPAFLAGPHRALHDDARRLAPPDARYAGFNLLLVAPAAAPRRALGLGLDAVLVTNHGAGGQITHRALSDAERQACALSNGVDGDGADAWPKVRHGLRAFRHVLETVAPDTPPETLAARLLDLLTWQSDPPPRLRAGLRETIQVDPITIGSGLYGTRLSTVVLVRRSGEALFIERDRWQVSEQGGATLADAASQRVFRFTLADA